jgi:hypothetical protein
LLPARLRLPTLDRFPLPGLDHLCDMLAASGVRQVSLTGTTTDPLLYRHSEALLAHLRSAVPRVQVSLHTNGHLALARIDTFNRYDRATVSLPSFAPDTCRLMTGSSRVVDLPGILERARIPIKVSILGTDHNRSQILAMLDRCTELGVRRAVLRRLWGDTRPWALLPGATQVGSFVGNPVYQVGPLEVTVWSFSRSTLRCLNLFPDGSISTSYELVPRSRTAKENDNAAA